MGIQGVGRARILIAAVVAAAVQLVSPPSLAQDYPARSISLIVPYGPGTGIDVIARELAQKLTETLGKPVVVENKAGASGNIGTDFVAQAKPDGYTILITSSSGILSQLTNPVRTNLSRDFEPIAFSGSIPFALAVPTVLPARSVAELVKLAKARPGQLNYAGFVGGLPQFLGEMLKSSAGVDIVMVPYKSTTDAQVDLVAGRVQVWFTTVASALPLVKGSKIRVLAVTSENRLRVLPDVPTMREVGYPSVTAEAAFFFLAPAGTPKAIVSKLNREIARALNTREVQARLAAQAVEPKSGSSEELGKYIQDELVRWEKVIKGTAAPKP